MFSMPIKSINLRLMRCAFVSVFIVLGLFQRASTSAQEKYTSGKIKGTVVDWQNARVTGARIVIQNSQFRRILKSDGEGCFEIELPAGKYKVIVNSMGFKKYEQKSVEIKKGAVLIYDIKLEVTPTMTQRCPPKKVCL